MNRWSWFLVCLILGLGVFVCGLLLPAHLRAVDASVIQEAGNGTPGLVARGFARVEEKNLGAAQLLLQAAQLEELPDQGRLSRAIDALADNPDLQKFGVPEPYPSGDLPAAARSPEEAPAQPFAEFVIRLENRERLLEALGNSAQPGVLELLRFRSITNTVLFPPASSASGQALDAALSICGLLVEGKHLTAPLNNSLLTLAAKANRVGDSQLFEQALMDVLSLGQRLNWGQLVAFVSRIEDAETLRQLAIVVRKGNAPLPVVFAGVEVSGKPSAVARYLMNFSQTGAKDLGTVLQFGGGGVNELLRRNVQLDRAGFRPALGAGFCLRSPWMALAVKWLLYLFSGFALAAALYFARPPAAGLEGRLEVRGLHVAREVLFALGFLVVVLLLSEPFLAQESQKVEFPFRLRLPTVGSVVSHGNAGASSTIMNQLSLLALLLFFILQGLLYTASVLKLAEIGRQALPPRMKLRLLENEDHLFDAGLYLGFVGTIISLILVSLGVIKPSLMAAYSSTSFGIIFVSIFKIFHLRPVRRRLLLEAETDAPDTIRVANVPKLVGIL